MHKQENFPVQTESLFLLKKKNNKNMRNQICVFYINVGLLVSFRPSSARAHP